MQIIDRDKAFRDRPLQSCVDGSYHTNRRGYEEHLKMNDCRIYEKDSSNARKEGEVRGDFNVREELTKATREVLSKN